MSARRPLVSVLIPVYNPGPFLRETVHSVLAQSHADFELIVVDDGSTDGATAAVTAIQDRRIAIVRQQQAGPPAALNAGLARATGTYIAFLDHDDVWLPAKLQRHVECFAQHPDTDLTFSWTRMIDEQGTDLGLPSSRWRGTITCDQLLEDFVIRTTSAMVVRRQALDRVGGLDASLPRLYDFDLALRIATLSPANCRAVPAVLNLYRRHRGQMSRDWRQLRLEWELLLDRVPAYAARVPPAVRAAADSNMHRYFAWLAFEQRDYRNTLALLADALGRAPGRAVADVRNWMLMAAACGGLLLPDRVQRQLLHLSTAVVRRR